MVGRLQNVSEKEGKGYLNGKSSKDLRRAFWIVLCSG